MRKWLREISTIRLVSVAMLCACLTSVPILCLAQGERKDPRPVSFNNRLLLNRAIVSGTDRIQVMLLVHIGRESSFKEHVRKVGGAIEYRDAKVGYLRVSLPTSKFAELVSDSSIDAYQISTGARGAWYRDGAPQINAEMFRGFEVRAEASAAKPVELANALPLLTSQEAMKAGYTADEGFGALDFIAQHPTFDGRGVTVAVVESATPNFTHPSLQSATTLTGEKTRKIVGIVNAIDPADPDACRVNMNQQVRASSTWVVFQGRTYILPHPGVFRIGVYSFSVRANVVALYGVLWDERSGQVWVDTDGDASFQNEKPMVDVNRAFDVGYLHTPSIDERLAFVIDTDPLNHNVHIYPSVGSHQTMTLSSVAGEVTENGLAFGVAPQAQLLLVRSSSESLVGIHNYFEAYLKAAQRRDVDLIFDELGVTMIPDGHKEFVGLFLSRVSDAYGKLIFHAAGNTAGPIGGVSGGGNAIAVGGLLSPMTFSSIFGPGVIAGSVVDPWSAWGPSDDGALKPDLIAPEHRIAADLCRNSFTLPLNRPVMRVPSCYKIACCTSSSTPIATGAAALLISGAKQQRLSYSAERLKNALLDSAHFLEGWHAYQQGNGALHVGDAWRALIKAREVAKISVLAPVNTVMSGYSNDPGYGIGIYEREGWSLNDTESRDLSLKRESGPTGPVAYDVSWLDNDGSFECGDQIRLPLNVATTLKINIRAKSYGVHSAILILKDHDSDAIAKRIPTSIVVPQRFTEENKFTVRDSGRVGVAEQKDSYFYVPPGTASVRLDFKVVQGKLSLELKPPSGLHFEYYDHVTPGRTASLAPGSYTYQIDNPVPGTWGLAIMNNSAVFGAMAALRGIQRPVSVDVAEYFVEMKLLHVELVLAQNDSATSQTDTLQVRMLSKGAAVERPAVRVSTAQQSREERSYLSNGQPNCIEMVIPEHTATLQLRADANQGSSPLELYLYDCTSGQCFSYDFRIPAQMNQTITVRDPKPGRWVAAINAAPVLVGKGAFTFQTIMAVTPVTQVISMDGTAKVNLPTAGQVPKQIKPLHKGEPVLFVEVVSQGTEEAELKGSLVGPDGFRKLKTRPVSLASTVYPIR